VGAGVALAVVAGGGDGAFGAAVAPQVLCWEKGLRGKSVILGWTHV
jgi:hypothetical protein